MVWGTLSFTNDNTDIYFDLTWPLTDKQTNKHAEFEYHYIENLKI